MRNKYKPVIRKNNAEIVQELIALGYMKDFFFSYSHNCIYVENGRICSHPGHKSMGINKIKWHLVETFDNEELFFALASVTDENDLNQYFMVDETSETDMYMKGDVIKWPTVQNTNQHMHKMDKDELRNYFLNVKSRRTNSPSGEQQDA